MLREEAVLKSELLRRALERLESIEPVLLSLVVDRDARACLVRGLQSRQILPLCRVSSWMKPGIWRRSGYN